MLVTISPAKTLDYESVLPELNTTHFPFPDDAQILIDELRTKSVDDIKSLMKLSDKLSELNVQRYKDWSLPMTADNARPAAFAFKGDVYLGLDIASFSDDDLAYAQERLCILSGLYGLLRPLDLIQPYRLEMGTRLANSRGKNLYEFWGTQVSEALNSRFEEKEILVNLASNEYSKAINKKALDLDVVTPNFLDCKKGNYKVISFYAKRARGYMAAWILKNRVKDVETLNNFNVEGYVYCEERSTEKAPVFMRDEL